MAVTLGSDGSWETRRGSWRRKTGWTATYFRAGISHSPASSLKGVVTDGVRHRDGRSCAQLNDHLLHLLAMFSMLVARRTIAQCRTRPGHVSRRLTSTSTSGDASSSTSSWFRTIRRVTAYTSIAGIAYTAGSLYPPTLATYISPRPAPPPLHPHDPEAATYVESLEDSLQHLAPLERHRESTNAADWYEARPYAKVPWERRVNSLTGGALHGPGKLALAPLVRAKRDNSEALVFVHVGSALCGHEGIVHGGALATLLDETLGRQVSAAYGPLPYQNERGRRPRPSSTYPRRLA